MNGSASLLSRLEDTSDWLSPLVVKEVRQGVRGREFILSFAASLVAGLAVAFFGGVDALGGNNSAGSWTFAAMMGCLAFLGLAVVPLGAFSALRNERMEQTLELITLTALSPRRVVVGKLLSQVVKLSTLFAAMAPFIAMSFLLGGIDFVTILISLVALFMASVWVGALCLFMSTAFRSRAMSGLVFGGAGLLVISLLVTGRSLFIAVSLGIGPPGLGGAASGGIPWWGLGIGATFWLASLVNLVLLAENRLSLPTEDSVTPLRLGFFVQFLLIVAWALASLTHPALDASRIADALAVFGSVHTAIVAVFVVTEEMTVPRRVLVRMTSASAGRWLLATCGPGGGRGAAYVLAQMAILLTTVAVLQPTVVNLHWLLAACGYICFYTGVPVLAFWRIRPTRATPLRLRVTVLVTVAAVTVLPDVLHYIIVRPDILNLSYAPRHLLNPFRTLANWEVVESEGWAFLAFIIGLTGLLSYLALIRLGARATGEAVLIDPHRPAPVAGEAGRGDVIS